MCHECRNRSESASHTVEWDHVNGAQGQHLIFVYGCEISFKNASHRSRDKPLTGILESNHTKDKHAEITILATGTAIWQCCRKSPAFTMNTDNVFYFKNITDAKCPVDSKATGSNLDTAKIVSEVKVNIQSLSNEDFSEVMIFCFIPDTYRQTGIKEKLFTKLTELMVGEWWRRMGGEFNLPTQKSGTQDVELIYNDKFVVCDAKVNRLGRSQAAPNVKDFLKLSSVQLWIDNLNESYKKAGQTKKGIGGLVTYASLFDWKKKSEVYKECTNRDTPVVKLSYEIMALLLKYKDHFKLDKFLNLWDYSGNGITVSEDRSYYVNYVTNFICNLLNISMDKYNNEMKEYHRQIMLACDEYKKIINNDINAIREKISKELDKYTEYPELKEYATSQIFERDIVADSSYIKNIDKFRHFSDQDDK